MFLIILWLVLGVGLFAVGYRIGSGRWLPRIEIDLSGGD